MEWFTKDVNVHIGEILCHVRKNHGGEDDYFLRKSDFGVIAQDVQEVFSVAVREKQDGSLAVDYEKLCALAFQAIKELKEEIDILKTKIEK